MHECRIAAGRGSNVAGQPPIYYLLLMSPEIAQFTPALFWDVDREELDIEKNRAFIVQRVLERGHDSDWELLKACYTIQGIVDTAKQLRSLEPTALAFASCIGNAKKEDFRCYTSKLSTPTHWVC